MDSFTLHPEPIPADPISAVNEGDRLEGCFDLTNNVFYPPQMIRLMGGRVLVDGKPIACCRYVNTDAGIVLTLDVLGDGQPHATSKGVGLGVYTPDDFPNRTVDCPPDGVLCERLDGKVEAFAGPTNASKWRKKMATSSFLRIDVVPDPIPDSVSCNIVDVTHA